MPYIDYLHDDMEIIKNLKSKRLINVIYSKGNYFLAEQPQKPVDKTEAYDTNLWLMPKFMQKVNMNLIHHFRKK